MKEKVVGRQGLEPPQRSVYLPIRVFICIAICGMIHLSLKHGILITRFEQCKKAIISLIPLQEI
jgi:hypothetical protein